MPTYTYGAFALNANSSGLGYFFLGKNIDLPVVKPTVFTIARRDGTKKSGEIIDGRQIDVQLRIVGSSRTDLISRIDTLQQNLAKRGQDLVIHEDGRVFRNVDVVSAPVKFVAGKDIVSADCSIVMRAYDPYAYNSTLSVYDSGNVALTGGSGVWTTTFTLAPPGNVFCLPLIRFYNRTASNAWTSFTVTQTNDNIILATSSTGAVPLPSASGDYIDIQCDPSASNGWTIQMNGSGLFSDPVGLFPVLEPGNTVITLAVAAASAPTVEAVISATARYLS